MLWVGRVVIVNELVVHDCWFCVLNIGLHSPFIELFVIRVRHAVGWECLLIVDAHLVVEDVHLGIEWVRFGLPLTDFLIPKTDLLGVWVLFGLEFALL